VREVRGGRELRVDGTFASLYRPGSPATGSVWDAIAAPVLALPPERRRRVLLLGLGGGSAARVVRAIAPRAEIIGVELDRDVIEAARRSFAIDELGLEIQLADAHAYLERERRHFDVVLEDVFVGAGDKVHKPDWLPHPGHELAARRVARGGLLVSNTLDEAPEVSRVLRGLYPAVVRIDVEDYDNRIFAAGPAALSANALRAEVARSPVLRGTLDKLRFRTVQAHR